MLEMPMICFRIPVACTHCSAQIYAPCHHCETKAKHITGNDWFSEHRICGKDCFNRDANLAGNRLVRYTGFKGHKRIRGRVLPVFLLNQS